MYCQRCGKEVANDASFCPNCGEVLNTKDKGEYYYGNSSNSNTSNTDASNNGYYGQNSHITNRSIAMCIILGIVTCGIYTLYWIICLSTDVKEASGDVDAPSGGMVILLTIVTCGIYHLYWLYKQGERLDNANALRGYAASSRSVLYLVLGIFGLSVISYALMQNELNQMA